MKVAGGGFEQCYNAQAAVATGSLLVVATDVIQAANDKGQLEPMMEKIEALPEELGQVGNAPRRQRLSQRGQRRSLRRRRDRAADRDGPSAAITVRWNERFAAGASRRRKSRRRSRRWRID